MALPSSRAGPGPAAPVTASGARRRPHRRGPGPAQARRSDPSAAIGQQVAQAEVPAPRDPAGGPDHGADLRRGVLEPPPRRRRGGPGVRLRDHRRRPWRGTPVQQVAGRGGGRRDAVALPRPGHLPAQGRARRVGRAPRGARGVRRDPRRRDDGARDPRVPRAGRGDRRTVRHDPVRGRHRWHGRRALGRARARAAGAGHQRAARRPHARRRRGRAPTGGPGAGASELDDRPPLPLRRLRPAYARAGRVPRRRPWPAWPRTGPCLRRKDDVRARPADRRGENWPHVTIAVYRARRPHAGTD